MKRVATLHEMSLSPHTEARTVSCLPLVSNVESYHINIVINVAAAVAAAVRDCISKYPTVYVLLMLINLVMIAVLHVKR